MVTTVKLQSPFEYSWWVVLIAAIVLAAALFALIYALRMIIRNRENKTSQMPAARKLILTPEVLRRIKGQYVGMVQSISERYSRGLLSKRDGYQELSLVIRGFVHEVTGINVENFTVKEVKAMGIRKLDVLMEEYYVPEFAEDEKAKEKDLSASCNVAMGVIKSWS
ncbi:MAG: hypothetical protein J6L93_02920 [Butyrivibrio sp.]|nr:hypothetical protein [Butyrivibrio sp.]